MKAEQIDLAFGFDFRTLLPKAFSKNPVMQTSDYVADNGELKALILVCSGTIQSLKDILLR